MCINVFSNHTFIAFSFYIFFYLILWCIWKWNLWLRPWLLSCYIPHSLDHTIPNHRDVILLQFHIFVIIIFTWVGVRPAICSLIITSPSSSLSWSSSSSLSWSPSSSSPELVLDWAGLLYALSQERSSSAAGGTDVPTRKSGPECESDLV